MVRIRVQNFEINSFNANMIKILNYLQAFELETFLGKESLLSPSPKPGDFITKVKQINSRSDLIWVTSFAGPSYLTTRSSVYIILI